MLVSLIVNLNMVGGNVPPPPTNDQSGDGMRKNERVDYNEQRIKRIMDEDNWLIPQVLEKILRECL